MAWLNEFGQAWLQLFFQPLFYWGIIIVFLTAYFRRKEERKNFGTAIYPIGAELRNTWLISLVASVVVSIGIIAIGGMVSYSTLVILSGITILLSLSGSLLLLSPAYTLGLTVLFVWLSTIFDFNVFPSNWLAEWNNVQLEWLLTLCVLFLIIEGILLWTTKKEHGFPRLFKGKRGKYVGKHMLKRLLIVPILLPVPVGLIEPFAPWWPLFPLGDSDTFGLLLFPMIVGVQQQFQGMYVHEGGRQLAIWTFALAFVTAGFTYGSLYVPILAPIAAAIVIFGRFFITLSIRFKDLENPIIYTPQPDGLLVLSVIPNTPADKMGLKVGEKIIKVHQHPVTNEQEFYDALSENRTFCKLEVLTEEGQVRFVQGPLYEGEHYELGLVFIKEKPRFRLYHDLRRNGIQQ